MNVIFSIPYAGGAASAYGELKIIAEKQNLILIPLELAGHASRLSEPPYKKFSEAVEDCYKMIVDYLHHNYVKNYAIFGHSMGSWIAYELVEKLSNDSTVDNPKKIFLSANTIPQIQIHERTNQLTDDEFWDWMFELGGMEESLYKIVEFKNYILPIIKNDYKLLEDYAGHNISLKKLDVDLYIMGGKQDSITKEEFLKWKQFTSKKFEIEWFEGNHFYFRNNPQKIVDYFLEKMRI